MDFEAVIGLEIHAELETESKMFCACPVVDVLTAPPNSAVCPVCAGMPGTLPVVNRRAVDFALRVALALNCQIAPASYFERKNYFYPDLPKGYQISQYQQPLASQGHLKIRTDQGEKIIRIRRVHLEEDTGKSTHIWPASSTGETLSSPPGQNHVASSRRTTGYSLVDLNRAGVPLLEIVTEPDLRTPAEVRAYAQELRSILRYLGVNSGDMQRGQLRIEPNISVRPVNSERLGTRTEVKNLNSFRALERSVAYEIERQSALIRQGGRVIQQTLGWDEARQETVPQRSKEEAEDYRYFPEPDLPPLVISPEWIASVQAVIPELPGARYDRFCAQYGLSPYDASVLVSEKGYADYFEAVLRINPALDPKGVANWITGDLFSLMNQAGEADPAARVSAANLAGLLAMLAQKALSNQMGARVLGEMFRTGQSAEQIVAAQGLEQVSDRAFITALVQEVLAEFPEQVAAYRSGKQGLVNWFFGQVMRRGQGNLNPEVVRQALGEVLPPPG